MINALRFRGNNSQEWRLWRFTGGNGRFARYQGLSANNEAIQLVAGALGYVLTGKPCEGVSEGSLHIADDAGHTWIIDRRSSGLRIMKDGEVINTDGEQALASALSEQEEATKLSVQTIAMAVEDGKLMRIDHGSNAESPSLVRTLMTGQMQQLAEECGKELGIKNSSDAAFIAQLAHELEPLYWQYREIARQYKDLTIDNKSDSDSEDGVIERLQSELDLIEEIAKTAEPLLAPGVNLKTLRDDIENADAAIIHARAAIGLPATGEIPTHDLRVPIEALCRLEAQKRLIRAAQGARKYCVEQVDPLHRQYLDATESSVVADRQIASELESCLASLALSIARGENNSADSIASHQKSWFERLKIRNQSGLSRDFSEPRVSDEDITAYAPTSDLENARMAVEFALARLAELEDSLHQARDRKTSALAQLDEAHEELVKSYGLLRAEWQRIAQQRGLPEDLTLEQLINIIAGFGEIAKLEEARTKTASRLRGYQSALTTVERLVLEWRQKTASQKTSGLSTPSLLIAEARDIIRYRETKQKRLASLRTRAAERLAEDTLRVMLRSRRQNLLQIWRTTLEKHGANGNIAIHSEILNGVFKRAALIRALALTNKAAPIVTPPRIFAQAGDDALIAIYVWSQSELDNHLRLAFLEELEAASGSPFRFLFVADESLGKMIAGLGVGMGSEVPAPKPSTASTAMDTTITPTSLTSQGAAKQPTPSLTVPRPASSPTPRTQVNNISPTTAGTNPQLSEKALQALNLLTGRRS